MISKKIRFFAFYGIFAHAISCYYSIKMTIVLNDNKISALDTQNTTQANFNLANHIYALSCKAMQGVTALII